MPFSSNFSEHFNKVPYSIPDFKTIGELTEYYYSTFGQESITAILEWFNEVVGEWNLGDYPP